MVVSHTTLSLRLTAVVGTRGFPSSLDITLDDVHLDHAFFLVVNLAFIRELKRFPPN